MIYSAIATYNFFKFTIHTFDDPVYDQAIAIVLACLQSLVIGLITGRLAQDFFAGQWYWLSNALAGLLFLIMAWNVYTDFMVFQSWLAP